MKVYDYNPAKITAVEMLYACLRGQKSREQVRDTIEFMRCMQEKAFINRFAESVKTFEKALDSSCTSPLQQTVGKKVSDAAGSKLLPAAPLAEVNDERSVRHERPRPRRNREDRTVA